VGKLWDHQEMGELVFSLPGVGQPIRALAKMPRRYSEHHYVWTGDLCDGAGQALGHAVFAQKGDKKFGSIEIGGRSFIIRDLNMPREHDQLLIEIDRELTEKGCGTGVLDEDASDPGTTAGGHDFTPPNGGCDAMLSILVLYTQEVIDAGRDPEQLAILGVADLNTALAESSIPDINVSAEVVGGVLLEEFIEDENGIDAVNQLAESVKAATLRDEHNADLVILFQMADMYIINPLTNEFKDIAGISAGINDVANANDTPDIDIAFSVIEASAPSKIFVHEVGHLLGCRHLKEDDPHEYANAHRFCVEPIVVNGQTYCNVYKSTIMDGDPYTFHTSAVLRFSNPEGSYMGYATGTNEHNNAKMISLTACPISQFGWQVDGGVEDPPFSAFPSGPTNVYHDNTVSFDYSSYFWGCAGGLVGYHWEISWDFGNTFQHLSFGQGAVLAGANVPPHVPVGFIRLTANCSQAVESVRFLEIKNWSAQNLAADPDEALPFAAMADKQLSADSETAVFERSLGFSAYPNPASDVLHVGLDLPLTSPVSVSLVTAQGVEYRLPEGVPGGSGAAMSFDVSNIPAGYYMLCLRSSAAHFRSPIIIVR
jgi:hypothetical protein